MKPVETMEAPASAGPENVSPELLAHEWDANGNCQSPELVIVDFGKKGGPRQCVILLGLCEDGTWRAGWTFTTKAGDFSGEPCTRSGPDFAQRVAALRVALGRAMQYFDGDRTGLQAISAVFTKSLQGGDGVAVSGAGEGAKNSPVVQSRPLPKGEPMDLPVAAIQRNPDQPRKDFPAIQEQELADSIASVGLLQRIIVRKLLPDELGELPGMDGQERYELIAGERRWRAHVRLERAMVAAEVYSGLSRAEAAAAALVENLQRQGLNPIEAAEGYRDLMLKEGLTQEACAQRVGVSRPVVANALRVLELPEKVIGLIREGKLTLAHGTALARFKAFPVHVGIMAEAAVEFGLTATGLEKGVPANSLLMQADLITRVASWDFEDDLPAELKKGPLIFKADEYATYCFDVGLYRRLLTEHKQAKKEAADAAAERERKRVAAAAKNPKKIKSLADLARGSYAVVATEDASLLALVPAEATLDLKEGGEDVKVCTKPALFTRIEDEVRKLKAADRKAKWPKLIVETLNVIARTKKLGEREQMLLLYLVAAADNVAPPPNLSEKYAKALGVKLPKKAMRPDIDGEIEFSREALALLMTETGPVDLYRLLIDSWVREQENDLIDCEYNVSADSDLATTCRWVLDRPELGFLEESKAGVKQLTETVKAQEWYQRAVAEIEGREYVPPPALKQVAAEKAKPGKKGGRK